MTLRSSIRRAGIVLSALALAVVLGRAAVAAGGGVTIIRDQEIEQALKTLALPIFRQAGLSPDAVRFILVQKDELNAFVAGGQNIFVYTGLILKTESAAELAGVLAHETGHIALGHLFRTHEAAENLSFQAILAQVLGVAAAIGTGSGAAGMAVASAGQTAALRGILTHSRTQESAADQAGVRFLTGGGLPVGGMQSFMEKLKSQELLPESRQSEYVRTHPLTQDRVDFLKEAASRAPDPAPPADWGKLHARMKAKLTGYLYPDQALTDRSETPDARYARAFARYRKGEAEKALSLLDALIREEPSNPYLHETKGQILFETGKAAPAAAAYAEAVRLAPSAGLIREAYGRALLESGRPQEAIAALQKALVAEPRFSPIHYFLAIAYGKTGQEGLSRLHLAEKYAMEGRKDFAAREARLALEALPKTGASAQRARDILEVAGGADAKKTKKK